MKLFRPALLLFSCGLLLLASCSHYALKGFVRKPLPDHRFMPVFNEEFEKSLYTSTLTFGEMSLTGIAIIKQIEKKGSFRVVCMAETGMKYFDFEFFPNDNPVVHYMMDALNRKNLVGMMTSDMGLIFKTGLNENETDCFESENSSGGFVLRQVNKGKRYYYYGMENQPPERIVQRFMLSPKIEVEVDYDSNQLPSGINISHGKAEMDFKLIPKR